MNMSLNEYALLIAVSLPVVTIAAIQLFLVMTGERGTGIFPALGDYPAVEWGKRAESQAVAEVVSISKAPAAVESSNESDERLAA
jgi:hypothetical protein